MLSPTDVIDIARAGGVALSLYLLLGLGLVWSGLLEWGPAVKREREQWQAANAREKAWGEQMQRERDDYKAQVEARQQAAEQALAIAQSQLQSRRERYGGEER